MIVKNKDYTITDEEKKYIEMCVILVKEAFEINRDAILTQMESECTFHELIKLLANNLFDENGNQYGSFKVTDIKEDKIGFLQSPQTDKKVIYGPKWTNIASYVIRTALNNHLVKGKKGFIYCDTDSLYFGDEDN